MVCLLVAKYFIFKSKNGIALIPHFNVFNEVTMLKSLHMLFIALSLGSFVGRVLLSEFKPEVLQNRLSKIAPHVIDTLLLLSGVTLILTGGWLEGEFGWIISKFLVLLGYIGLGVICMHNRGLKRWLAFAGALACFVYIFVIAITKHGFI
jgi:uncharacterized membrane protein SirB2